MLVEECLCACGHATYWSKLPYTCSIYIGTVQLERTLLTGMSGIIMNQVLLYSQLQNGTVM